MQNITNGAPGLLNYGVKDGSVRSLARPSTPLPQHLPKFFIYGQKGPSILDEYPEQLVVGNQRNQMYGDETFAEVSKYFNHQTVFANAANAVGNAGMYVRLLGVNHGPKPTLHVSLDVLKTKIDLYERNTDGSYKLDAAGDPKPTGSTVDGYRVKVVVGYNGDLAQEVNFGQRQKTAGDQVDAATGVQSERIPLFDIQHSFYGEDGNLAGLRFWGQTEANTGSLPVKMINTERAYPFNFGVVRKNPKTGNVKFVESIFGEQFITVTLKPNVIDPLTNKRIGIMDRAIKEYRNLTDPRYDLVYGEFGQMKMYQENIDELVAMFHAAEVAVGLEDWHDFNEDESDKYLFNFITGVNTSAAPYNSFIFVNAADSVRFSPNTNVFLAGGSDGEMTNDNFADSVSEYMGRYADPNDELQDDAYHVESHIYDSGFPLDTKYDLIKFISERKDTFVHLVPYTDGERRLTRAEEYSIASALMSRVSMYPESTYFGTPVYRAMVTGCSVKIRGMQTERDYPALFEVLSMSAKYMGAANGEFKSEFRFEGYPGHILKNSYDVSIRHVPDSIRVRNWDMGLNWVARFDREQFYFPALKTVYNEDTSVLTGYVFACVLLTVNKALSKCQRVFSGRSDLTPAQFTTRVNNWLTEELRGKFDNRVTIIPRAQFTSMDEIRNYSWTVPVDVGGEGMKTVMTAYAVARRQSELAQ